MNSGHRIIEPVVTLPGEFADGYQRPFDRQFRDLISLRAARTTHPLEVLEIAAGSSFPGTGNRNFGAPWLARSLACEIPAIEITVSDLNSLGSLLCRCHDGTLVRLRFLNIDDIELPAPTSRQRGHLSFTPILPQMLAGVFSALEAEVAGFFLEQSAQGARFYVAPHLDPAIESAYGIKLCKPGVEALELAQYLPGRQYDVVFARHLQPKFVEARFALARSIGAVLKPHGIGLIGIDRGNRDGSDLYMIRSGGHIRRVHSLGGMLGWRGLSFSFLRSVGETETNT